MSDSSNLPEFEPPQACINRILKSVMPDNVQITKDSRVRLDNLAVNLIIYILFLRPHLHELLEYLSFI